MWKPFVGAPVFVALLLAAPAISAPFDGVAAAATTGGTTFVVPRSIDATGTRDVTDALDLWLATKTADGTAAAPNRIVFNGTYRVEYGITIGSSGPSVYRPDLPAYTRNHVVLDLTHAALVQRDPAAFTSVNGVVSQPRKRWGVPIIKLLGGQDIEVRGGLLLSTNDGGHYSTQREAWHGIFIVGTDGVKLSGLHIAGVWGDFVNVSQRKRVRARNIVISGGKLERNGRQGITMNGVDGLEIADVEFRDVERLLFDSEPLLGGGLTNVNIHDCFGNTGGLGFASFRPLKLTPLANISIRNHHLISGHFKVSVVTNGIQRENISIVGNTSATTTPFSQGRAMIAIGGSDAGFDGVQITNNHDLGDLTNAAVAISPLSTKVVTAPNSFTGFR